MLGESREWKWIIEWQSPTSAHLHGVKEVIYAGKSKYQNIEIVELYDFGKTLILDGKVQSSISDEYIYHEVLVHPSMITHLNPKRVLIIGGGEGATAREALKHKSVEEVVMVDLDLEVVEFCKKYLPEWNSGVFEDPRFKLVIGDGREYVEACREEFDVVIVDVTDPLEEGPSYKLYTLEFYKAVKKALKPNGLVVTQATSTSYTLPAFATIVRTVNKVFRKASPYYTMVPSYTSEWGFVAASDYKVPSELNPEEVDALVKERILGKLRFYSGDSHKRIFVLDERVRSEILKGNTIATDENPVFMPA